MYVLNRSNNKTYSNFSCNLIKLYNREDVQLYQYKTLNPLRFTFNIFKFIKSLLTPTHGDLKFNFKISKVNTKGFKV